MATTTTNFGWDIPQSTDLVKDGATAIAALGQDIDTAMVDLKGGTTGQVLAKASGTDLDFSWVAQDDSNAIQNAIVDAKGDLISATAADTPARLAVGTNGQVLTADSAESTGMKWATAASGGMTEIASGTVTGGLLSISSIASTYNHLQLWMYNFDPGSSSGSPSFRVNGDTGSTYYMSDTALYYDSKAPEAYWAMSMNFEESEATAQIIANFFNYSSTANHKVVEFKVAGKSNTNNSNASIGIFYGGYRSTSAISSITTPFNNQGGTSMTFDYKLYGVK